MAWYRAKVDALGRQPHRWLIGVRARRARLICCGAPLLGQPVDDERAQLGVASELRLFGSPASLRGEDLGVERAVLPSGVEIAAQLTADRRSGPAQRLANHGRTITPAGQVSDPDPFLLREEPGRDRTNGERFQRWQGWHGQVGPPGTRRVDNEDLQTQAYVASFAGNHPVVLASDSSVVDNRQWLSQQI